MIPSVTDALGPLVGVTTASSWSHRALSRLAKSNHNPLVRIILGQATAFFGGLAGTIYNLSAAAGEFLLGHTPLAKSHAKSAATDLFRVVTGGIPAALHYTADAKAYTAVEARKANPIVVELIGTFFWVAIPYLLGKLASAWCSVKRSEAAHRSLPVEGRVNKISRKLSCGYYSLDSTTGEPTRRDPKTKKPVLSRLP